MDIPSKIALNRSSVWSHQQYPHYYWCQYYYY
jgi:hypothetical protein